MPDKVYCDSCYHYRLTPVFDNSGNPFQCYKDVYLVYVDTPHTRRATLQGLVNSCDVVNAHNNCSFYKARVQSPEVKPTLLDRLMIWWIGAKID